MKILMGEEDVEAGSKRVNFTHTWLVLDPNSLSANYRDAKYQLWFCSGGFGADPEKIGRKIFGVFAADFDSQFIATREGVLGVATDEAIEGWKKQFPELADNIEKIEKRKY